MMLKCAQSSDHTHLAELTSGICKQCGQLILLPMGLLTAAGVSKMQAWAEVRGSGATEDMLSNVPQPILPPAMLHAQVDLLRKSLPEPIMPSETFPKLSEAWKNAFPYTPDEYYEK